jgi:hypothetical protein
MLHQEKVQSVAVFTRQAKKKRKHPNILKKKKKKLLLHVIVWLQTAILEEAEISSDANYEQGPFKKKKKTMNKA